jgi:hypothetical protein
MSTNDDWPKNVEPPPWHTVVTGAYAAPFPEEPPRAPRPYGEQFPGTNIVTVSDPQLSVKYESLRRAVKMAVRAWKSTGTDGIEGIMDGLEEALEEIE